MILLPTRKSDAEDLAVPLSKLGAATFTNTFGHLYRTEDLDYFLTTAHSAEVYRQAILSDDQPIWVVENGGELVAYIKLCPNGLPCDPALPNAIEISKLYTLSNVRGQGLGSRLVKAAIDYARQKNFNDMVLSVYSENFDGQRFYARHGFKKIGEYEFPVGQQLDREWIMHRTI